MAPLLAAYTAFPAAPSCAAIEEISTKELSSSKKPFLENRDTSIMAAKELIEKISKRGRFFVIDRGIVSFRDLKDSLHFASNTCEMNWNDYPDFGGNQRFHMSRIHVKVIFLNLTENRFRPPQNKRIYRGNESIRRHNVLISRLDIEQKSGHLQSMRSRSGQQHFSSSKSFLEKLVA